MLLKSFILRAIYLSILLNVFDSTLQTKLDDDTDNDLDEVKFDEELAKNKTILSQENIDELINLAVEDIEEIAKNCTKKTHELAQKLDEESEYLKNKTLKFLQKMKKRVAIGSNLIDESLNTVTGYHISNKTCGIINFRKTTGALFHITQACLIKYIDNITDNIQNIVIEGGKISDQLVNVTTNIKTCSKIDDSDLKVIKKCISKQKLAALGIAKSAIFDVINVKNMKNVVNWGPEIKNCLGSESLGRFKNKTAKVWSCLHENVPGFTELNDFLQAAGKFIDKDVLIELIHPYVDELKKLPEKISNGFKKGIKKMKLKLQKLQRFFKKLANG